MKKHLDDERIYLADGVKRVYATGSDHKFVERQFVLRPGLDPEAIHRIAPICLIFSFQIWQACNS